MDAIKVGVIVQAIKNIGHATSREVAEATMISFSTVKYYLPLLCAAGQLHRTPIGPKVHSGGYLYQAVDMEVAYRL